MMETTERPLGGGLADLIARAEDDLRRLAPDMAGDEPPFTPGEDIWRVNDFGDYVDARVWETYWASVANPWAWQTAADAYVLLMNCVCDEDEIAAMTPSEVKRAADGIGDDVELSCYLTEAADDGWC